MQQSRCALLTFILGILLVTANCGDKMVVPTSGAAGKVISAEGNVTATRKGEKTRPLVDGDIVYVKDTASTGANSSVSIELTHNRAVWSLDNNQDLAKQAKIGNSAAAADNVRSAAETTATLQKTSANEAAMPAPASFDERAGGFGMDGDSAKPGGGAGAGSNPARTSKPARRHRHRRGQAQLLASASQHES